MKQQDKEELLLKDLCARLPYRVKCQFEDTIEIIKEIWFCEDDSWQVDGEKTSTCIYAIKPYLFPRSSMTEEQKIEEYKLMNSNFYTSTVELSDFYNKNHIDYRGLIPLGLAKDATGLGIYGK